MTHRPRAVTPIPRPESPLEAAYALLVRANGWPEPAREYQFASPRKFAFDFAWPVAMVAVECEGGLYIQGRHLRPAGYEKDCEKYNLAALGGWRVLRFTAAMINDGTAERMTTQALDMEDL